MVGLNRRYLPLCRGDRGEDNLVEKPSSHEKLLSAIKERAKYEAVKLELWSVLNDVPFKDIEEKVSLQSKCYQDTTHSGMFKRARERYEREVAGPDESRRKPGNSPLSLEEAQVIDR